MRKSETFQRAQNCTLDTLEDHPKVKLLLDLDLVIANIREFVVD